ncbi:transglycosylase domain-containing protein [Actinoplanes sp. NPDC051633]|uniref:transglycosylase domain-containing protein n=1 Tax=Actinoplanes sp. NPDC051633 TaxID=3155670 RepID=UPI00343E901B
MIALALSGAGLGGLVAYVESQPLPDDPPGPQASVLYYRDGRTILARVGTTDHNDVPLSKVPVEVRRAVLAAEDRDFTGHGGVSIRGVLRAVVADLQGGRQGASTITQQYARNAFLTQDVSIDRKAREFALAIKLERKYTKDQILERYLNTIYYGRGAYGIAAAANAYFGVPPERLTPAQGAVLAAVVKDPRGFDPAIEPVAARERWTWIVKAAAELGWLPADLAYPEVAKPRAGLEGPNGQAVDQIERELVGKGITSQDLHTKGLSIVTTLDPVGQPAALEMIADQLGGEPDGLRAALVALDPKTGGVRAYYGSDRGRGYFDYATALHPAASTFKPIVLTAALERGISYRSRWDGSSPRVFAGRGPLVNHGGLQCPDCTLEQAMVESLNTPFYAVTEKIGADAVREAAVRLGIPDRYDNTRSMVDVKGDPEPGRTRSDIALGRYPVTPADLATVYGTFAAGGERHARYFVERVSRADGKVLLSAEPTGRVVLDRGVAADVSAVLGSVVKGDRVVPGRPAAGKTGTQQFGNTKDNQDAWMAGYTPDLATVIWLGKEKPGPIRDRKGKPIQGDTVPAKLWQRFVSKALEGRPTEPLPEPANLGRTDVGDAGQTGTAPPGGDPTPVLGPYDPVVRTAGQGKRLALTFDDGPSEYTGQILDLLAEHRIRAVFCMVGEEVEKNPEMARRVVEQGHKLCNHSWEHDDLGAMPAGRAMADIERTNAALAKAVPGRTVTWFRAPFGSWGKSARAGAELGMTPLGWTVDPDDWTLPGAQTIRKRIRSQLQPRAVVLVHDGGGVRDQTVAALRNLIPELLADGWTFDLPETTNKGRQLTAPENERKEEATKPPPSKPAPAITGSAPPDGVERQDRESPRKSPETGRTAPGKGA